MGCPPLSLSTLIPSSMFSLSLASLTIVLLACSTVGVQPKADQTRMQPRACDGQLIGPNSTAGQYGMRLSQDWAMVSTEPSGLGGCFFKVDSSVGKAIFANCTVGHRCLVVGAVQKVRGFFGNVPGGGPAADILSDLFTTLDITTIEEETKRSCR
jgi:hypothetical protein